VVKVIGKGKHICELAQNISKRKAKGHSSVGWGWTKGVSAILPSDHVCM